MHSDGRVRHGGRRFVLLCAVVLVLLTPDAGSAARPAAVAAAKATFGIGPANAKGLDGRPYLNYLSDPGGRISDRVAVSNYGLAPVTLQVYAADATASGSGAIGFDPESAPGSDASTWVRFADGAHEMSVTLAARHTRVLPLTVAVPVGASPGDHLIGVMAALTGQVVGKNGKVHLQQRVALRALFRISGDVRTQLAVEHLEVAYHDNWNPFGSGSATVTYSVRNAGNVLLSGRQKVLITGILGSTGAMKTLVRLPLLLPGSAFPMRVEVPDVSPEFRMHARVTVTPLAVAGSVDPQLEPASATASFWAVPWMLLALVLLLVGLVALWIWRIRHRKPGAHAVRSRKPSDALVNA